MRELGQTGGQDLAIASDFAWGKAADVVVDVGGGQGALLRSILQKHAALKQVGMGED
jgi:16S rRNA A1518/A1519 N6-dimethyltransferase RsmA/KsgA/DIM1 with predicted DNA glycosylase/AP lyase activity